MRGNPPSDLERIKQCFPEAIQHILPTDSTGRTSSAFAQRATIVFADDSKLYVTETLKSNRIDDYQYDWIAPNGVCRGKYHCEDHNEEGYQTDTEPYHVHPQIMARLTNKTRYPNYLYQDLFSIVEGIFLFYLIPNKPHV